MNGLLVYPQELMMIAEGDIIGVTQMLNECGITKTDQYDAALMVCEEWSESWDENQGFGSSDMTYMVQDYLKRLVWDTGYETKFLPNKFGFEVLQVTLKK